MTSTGLKKSEDGQSFEIRNIGNGMMVDADPGDLIEIPFYVLALAGTVGSTLRLSFELEYPDGAIGEFQPQDATKPANTAHRAIEWHAGLMFPFRMSGVHWMKTLLNGEFKTETAIRIQRAGELVDAKRDGFQA